MSKYRIFFSSLGRFSSRAVLLSTVVFTAACAAIPDLGPAPAKKPPEIYTAAKSFAAPAVDWPSDEWWKSYGDEQLDRLISEALAGAPNLAEAEARLQQAQSFVQQAGASRLPQLSAQSSISGIKQSYNDGIPAAAVPRGWNDSGQASLNLFYEFDFWGKNRASIAAAISSAEAARADQAQARLTLAAAVASAYAQLVQLHADLKASGDAVLVRVRKRNWPPSMRPSA
jgi:outer membrane protein TolC